MPFNFLVWNCLEPNRTAIKESGKTARFAREQGECILAFRLDCSAFRTQFKPEAQKVCDGMFFYWRAGGVPVVLFVELKGRDVKAAVEQLSATLDVLRPKAPSYRPKLVAVVVTKRGVPKGWGDLSKTFGDRHGARLVVSRDGDMRQFL